MTKFHRIAAMPAQCDRALPRVSKGADTQNEYFTALPAHSRRRSPSASEPCCTWAERIALFALVAYTVLIIVWNLPQ